MWLSVPCPLTWPALWSVLLAGLDDGCYQKLRANRGD
jgi:hypothetical protein